MCVLSVTDKGTYSYQKFGIHGLQLGDNYSLAVKCSS